MVSRRLPLLVLLLAGAPSFGAAQPPPDEGRILTLSRARLSLTPFLGMRAPFVSDRRATVVLPGLVHPTVVVFDAQRAGGGVAGVEAELRLLGPVGVAGAVGFTNPDEIATTVRVEGGAITETVLQGPSVWFARADLSYELPAPRPDERSYRPAAYLLIGPALVREEYGDGLLALDDGDDAVDNWALHVGIKGLFPFGPRGAAFYLMLEDYATFWNPRDQERRRIEHLLSVQPGTVLNTAFDYSTTHVFMLGLGLSLRL